MRFSLAVAALSVAVSVWAQTDHQVMVGQGGLTFTPNSITVKNGDSVTFSFMAKNHTVTQSTFLKPCERQTSPSLGVDSGFQAIPPTGLNGATPPQWKITITNASAPLWFYCAQKTPANHCTAGMVFAINPNAEKTFDAFLANAKGTGGAEATPPAGSPSTPTTPIGGAPNTAGATIPTSLGSIPTGSVPPPAAGLPISEQSGGAPAPLPTNGAGRLTSGLTGLMTLAVVAMLL